MVFSFFISRHNDREHNSIKMLKSYLINSFNSSLTMRCNETARFFIDNFYEFTSSDVIRRCIDSVFFSSGSLIKALGVILNSASKQTLTHNWVWALKLPNSAKKNVSLSSILWGNPCVRALKTSLDPGTIFRCVGKFVRKPHCYGAFPIRINLHLNILTGLPSDYTQWSSSWLNHSKVFLREHKPLNLKDTRAAVFLSQQWH